MLQKIFQMCVVFFFHFVATVLFLWFRSRSFVAVPKQHGKHHTNMKAPLITSYMNIFCLFYYPFLRFRSNL